MIRPRLPHVAAGVATSLLLALTACSPDAEPVAGPPASAPADTSSPAPLPLPVLTTDPAAPPRLRLADDPAYESGSLRSDAPVQVVGDLALVGGGADPTVAVVDLRTGATRWSIEGSRTIPGTPQASYDTLPPVLVAGPGRTLVVGGYYALDCAYDCTPAGTTPDRSRPDQTGVVAVDAGTGRAVWGAGLSGSTQDRYLGADADESLVSAVVGAHDGTVVAAVADLTSSLVGDGPSPRIVSEEVIGHAVGLDAATGERRWVRRDLRPTRVVGRTVLALTTDDAPVLVALDAATGDERWRADRPLGPSGLQSATSRVVAVDLGEGDPLVYSTSVLLDTATGRRLAEQPPAGAQSCVEVTGGPLDVVCAWREPERAGPVRLLTLRDGATSLSAATYETGDVVTLATARGIVVERSPVGDQPGRVVVDAAGTVLSEVLDQRVADLTDAWAVLGGDGRTTEVVRLR